MFGAGGGTSSYCEVEETEFVLLWGSNARAAHPIYFHHVLKGIRNGASMFAVDPRYTDSAKFADAWLGLNVGTDIALANAIAREIIVSGLYDEEFISRSTSGFAEFAEQSCLRLAYRTSNWCDAGNKETAHRYATAIPQILWTLGITEHHNGVENQYFPLRPLCDVGRWESGLVPLRSGTTPGRRIWERCQQLPGFKRRR